MPRGDRVNGDEFRISYTYKEPACPILIHCVANGGVGIPIGHEDRGEYVEYWEAISLADPYSCVSGARRAIGTMPNEAIQSDPPAAGR